MKKKYGTYFASMCGLLLAACCLGCTPTVRTPANELDGKKGTYTEDDWYGEWEFYEDTYRFLYKERYYYGFGDLDGYSIYVIEEETGPYFVDSEVGYFAKKRLDSKKTYILDGKVFYTESNELPKTLDELKAEHKKFLTALDPDLSESELQKLMDDALKENFDGYCNFYAGETVTEEMFNLWREEQVEKTKPENNFYEIFAYKVNGSKIIISCDDIGGIPYGMKFKDIFNNRYELHHRSYDEHGNEFDISFYSLKHLHRSWIYISNKGSYVILSAADKSMRLVKTTGSEYGRDIYDENDAIDCPITYSEETEGEHGKVKIVATVEIDGDSYSFDIEYLTKEYTEYELEGEIAEFTL